MKTLATLSVLLLSIALKSQEKYFVDYNKYCNKIEFEDLQRLMTRVDAYCLEYNLLTIELTTVINCGEADTGFFKYSNDTLFLYTEQVPRITVTDGDTTYFNGVVECDCFFNISFDIYGFSEIPKNIYFNGKSITLKNIKYKNRETFERNGHSEILFDDCGYNYRFQHNKSQKIERIYREMGLKRQIFVFNENQKLIEIKTIKNSIENVKSIKIR
jgi:hypothetical protein